MTEKPIVSHWEYYVEGWEDVVNLGGSTETPSLATIGITSSIPFSLYSAV